MKEKMVEGEEKEQKVKDIAKLIEAELRELKDVSINIHFAFIHFPNKQFDRYYHCSIKISISIYSFSLFFF